MIPDNITSEHIKQALQAIDSEGVPASRQSTKFDLAWNGIAYPPKYVLSKANVYANGVELLAKHFQNGPGDSQANAYLAKLGFTVVPKLTLSFEGSELTAEELLLIETDEMGKFPRPSEGLAQYKKLYGPVGFHKFGRALYDGCLEFGFKVKIRSQVTVFTPSFDAPAFYADISPGGHQLEFHFSPNDPRRDAMEQELGEARDLRKGYKSFDVSSQEEVHSLLEVVSSLSGGLPSIISEKPKRNPDWVWEEVVLGLDYYLTHTLSECKASHPGLIELSNLLRSLPFHSEAKKLESFRNPDGCELTLNTFRGLDTDYKGMAPTAMAKKVWKHYGGNVEGITKAASAIRSLVADQEALVLVSQPVEDEEGFHEGALKLRMHRARERNQALVDKAKKVWLAKDPLLRCECCGFSFKETFGVDFIEAHHRKPISELDGPVKAKVEDLAPVCANCHRMLHRMPSVMVAR